MIPSSLEQLRSITFFPVVKIFTYANDESNRVYDSICNQCAIKLLKNTMKTLSIVIVSMAIYSMFPVAALLRYNEVQLMIPVLFPFTNLESQIGIIVNMLNQLLTGTMGLTANIGIEVLNCILTNAVWTSAVVVCYSIDELSQVVRNPKQFSVEIIDYHLRNIVTQVQDIDRYLHKLI